MPVIVRLPNILKNIAGSNIVSVEGDIISEALEYLCEMYPEIKTRIYKNDGKINPFLIICLNGEDVRLLKNLETKIKNGDEISIIPMMSGG